MISFFDIGHMPVNAAWAAVILCGVPIIKGAMAGLAAEFDIKADVLVSIALIASVIIGEIFAAGEIAFIMTIGAYLEERTVAKARAGIEKLVRLTPTNARVVRDGEEMIIPSQEVKVGDIVRVLAGETIAADGLIIAGQTSVDQSVMTGEPLPVDKSEGDSVSSGTVNQFGVFDMVAQQVGEDSSLRRMIRLVESADAGKAKIVGAADRWATWMVIAALAAAAITWFVTGAIIRSVTVLVVFCPCALVLATPTAIMAGIGNAAKCGILIRAGDALERLSMVRRVAFDKTGTLTYGKPTVVQIESRGPDISQDALLALAAAAETRSEHPLGKAIVSYYKQKTGAAPKAADGFQMIAGRGVSANIGDTEVLGGNEALLSERGAALPEALRQAAGKAKEEGGAVVYFTAGHKAIGFIALSDVLRPDAAGVIEDIHKTGAKTILLTGDASQTAQYIAKAAGIAELRPDCLPEDKLQIIRERQKNGEPICMVGDGVNDAPALKAAHVSIAMGGVGSDIAIDAADMVLVGDDIAEIPHLLSLSKKTMKTIRVNLAASMLLNAAAVLLAVTGVLSPVAGALVHNAGSVAVIIHSSLLLHWRAST
jgi:heavy metal translocating P-type ATPase